MVHVAMVGKGMDEVAEAGSLVPTTPPVAASTSAPTMSNLRRTPTRHERGLSLGCVDTQIPSSHGPPHEAPGAAAFHPVPCNACGRLQASCRSTNLQSLALHEWPRVGDRGGLPQWRPALKFG